MDLNYLNTCINEAGMALSDASAALAQGHTADVAAALSRVDIALVAIQKLHDGDVNAGGPPPANVGSGPTPQTTSPGGDSWYTWGGHIPVTSLGIADLRFAVGVETMIDPHYKDGRTYGSLFWRSRIGGTADQVKAWRELAATQAATPFDFAAYVAADPHGLVAAARDAGVAV